ncbi:MAG: endolytic transglycosylase MltG [Erythrobacter sp.]|nr:endolytic transglycosylase MltG [Erythrobacter sp.]
MKRLGLVAGLILAALLVLGIYALNSVFGDTTIEQESSFVIPAGSTLTSVAHKLEEQGHISSAKGFLLRAKLLGNDAPIQAGEFRLAPGMSQGEILEAFQRGDVIRRMITVPEGMPSILVHERLMAENLLTGAIDVPPEGSVLPDSYDFERGETRAAVLARMQSAMRSYLAEAWKARASGIAVKSPQEALILASVVEKETGVATERRMVAGLYSNRLKMGMRLQADPTIIYPITRGKPLGRRILRSEIDAVNDYNTYAMAGLPKGPITNPGRESIAAVLNPAQTGALYMVADGSGGHAFADTLTGHEANVAKWRAIRRARGEI